MPESKTREQEVRERLAEWKAELEKRRERVVIRQKLLRKAQARLARGRKRRRALRAELEQIRASQVERRVLEAAASHIGKHETPINSNRGPGIIDDCQREFGFSAVPYCGCFVGYILRRVAGLTQVNSRIAYTPFIWEDAQKGVNGLERLVAIRDAQPGDLVLFHFGSGGIKHVGFFLRWENGLAVCIEGNTSAGDSGSQDNGGGIYRRVRHTSLIHSIARPRYA